MEDELKFKIIGQTLDDAVGEAYDKVSRLLNLGYPEDFIKHGSVSEIENKYEYSIRHKNVSYLIDLSSYIIKCLGNINSNLDSFSIR